MIGDPWDDGLDADHHDDVDGHRDEDVDGHHGQVRFAYRLAESYRDKLIHVHNLGWHYWDESRWAEDDQGVAQRAVLDVLKSALVESLDDKDQPLRRDVARCESAAGVAGVLAIAAALTAFAKTVRDLDQDPHLLNCTNGTLDLRTFELQKHDPRDYITKVTAAAYDEAIEAGEWHRFLTGVLPEDDVREFLQRVAGVSLLGKVIEHILVMLTGVGANGKSTLYKAVLSALGDYADTVDPDLFMLRDGAHPTGEMDLRGLRLIVTSESDRDRQLAEATMKRLTGGDRIKARRMRMDFVSFEPSHTAMFVTNHLPKVRGDDPAVWRRIKVIPFKVVFSGDEQDKGLDDRLRLAADEILTWAVAGWRMYQQSGLDEPDAVQAATDAYHQESDPVERFIVERCEKSPNAMESFGDLHAAWSRWSLRDGAEPMSAKAFGLALDMKGYREHRTNKRRLRRGLLLLAEEDSDQ